MKVLVAMSGGVDSSVAAALLVDAGHEVVGATLKLWGGSSDSGCCTVSDVDDARRVAQVLGVDHHVFNYTEEFERLVVNPFVEAYANGEAPNPCIECNRTIKFDLLFERAERLGFDAVATGHHAQVVDRDGCAALVRGADPAKDQSYVLGYLGVEQLNKLLLPIGHLTKEEVREIAETRGLRTWDKPDSQDVCFIEASRGREAFLRERITLTPATLVDAETGDVVGETDAAELMTVGQRRGVLPGRHGERRFVASIDLPTRRVTVAPLANIVEREITLDAATLAWTTEPLTSGQRVLVQCSAHGAALAATVHLGESPRVLLDEPARPVAVGQSVVIYLANEPDRVAGAARVTR